MTSQQGATARTYQSVIAAVASEPTWRAIIATANLSLAARLAEQAREAGPRVAIRDWVPRASVLAEADVVITHGGANSVKEAILGERPLLVLPHSADQPGNAARVIYHGIGLIGSSLNPDSLRAQIGRLLTEQGFKQAVSAMAVAFRRYDRHQICVQMLERAAKGRMPRFDDPELTPLSVPSQVE